MTRNNDLLMLALSRFFSEKKHVDTLLDVLQGKNTVSLRLLDYFVTNYARKHKTTIAYVQTMVVCVHSHYRSQLKAFSKQRFDPFKRRERIVFELNPENSIETTVGQLNFFRWAIETGVLQYVVEHRAEIERDMCNASHDDDERKNEPRVEEHARLVEPDHQNSRIRITGCVTNQLHVTQFSIPQVVMFD
jgi:hypothetical protein